MNVKENKFFNGIKHALDTNAPTLATFGSILGIGLTIFFMHRASKSAVKVEERYEEEVNDIQEAIGDTMDEEEAKEEKAHAKLNKYMRLVYIYRWALLSGIGSAGFAVLSNYLNGRTIATITGLLALNNEKLKEYAKKGKEMLGEDKFKELQENVEKEIFGKKVEKGDLKVEKSKAIKNDDTPWDEIETYYIPWSGEMWQVPKPIMDEAIRRATGMFKKNSAGKVADKTAYLGYNTFRSWCRIPAAPAYDIYYWDASNPFNGWETVANKDENGWTRSIAFPNQPMVDTSTTR